MEGIPEDVVQSHNQRVITQFSQAEAERRAATGNATPGSASSNPAKKPKFETSSDLKKRLAEHKARKAEEEAAAAAAAQSAETTPLDPMVGQGAGFNQPPGFVSTANPHLVLEANTTCQSTSPGPGFGQPFAPPPAPGFNGFPQPYGQPGAPFQAPTVFGSPPGPQFQQQPQFPQQQFPTPNNAYAPPSQYQAGPGQGPPISGPPRAFGANTPPVPFQGSPPPQGMPQGPRPSNLPAAPGLPQRPSFGAPPVSTFQLQQMHQGQVPGPATSPFSEQQPNYLNGNSINAAPSNDPGQPSTQVFAGTTTSPGQPNDIKEEGKSVDASIEKKSKKDKDKDVRLVYSDNDVSPEEKMARLPRYAFDPRMRDETVLGDPTAAVTGVVSGPNDPARDSNRGPGKDN